MADTAELQSKYPETPKDHLEAAESTRSETGDALSTIFPDDPNSVSYSFFDQFKTESDYWEYGDLAEEKKDVNYRYDLDTRYDRYCRWVEKGRRPEQAKEEKEDVKPKKPKAETKKKPEQKRGRREAKTPKPSKSKKRSEAKKSEVRAKKRTPENKSERSKLNLIEKIQQIEDLEALRVFAKKYAEKKLIRLELRGDTFIAHVHSKAIKKEFAKNVCQALNERLKSLSKKEVPATRKRVVEVVTLGKKIKIGSIESGKSFVYPEKGLKIKPAKKPEARMEEGSYTSPKEIAKKILIAAGFKESDVKLEMSHAKIIQEDVKKLSQAIKANPELRIINQVLGAFARKQDSIAGVPLIHDQMEYIIRKAVDYIDKDGKDIKDTISDEDKEILFIETPTSLTDFVKLEFTPDDLPAIARDLTKLIEETKQKQSD